MNEGQKEESLTKDDPLDVLLHIYFQGTDAGLLRVGFLTYVSLVEVFFSKMSTLNIIINTWVVVMTANL